LSTFAISGIIHNYDGYHAFPITDNKIPNSKHQITNKSQIPIFNDPNWNFEFWSLGFICDLIFVICYFNFGCKKKSAHGKGGVLCNFSMKNLTN